MLFVVALVSFSVALLTLFSGFGLGTLLMPTLALFFPAPVAVLLTAIVHGCNSLFKLALLWRQADYRVVLRFGIPAALAALLGAATLAALSGGPVLFSWSPPLDPLVGRMLFWQVSAVEAVLGVLILLFAALEVLPATRRLRFAPRWLPLGGAIAGFFGGLSGHQGALRAAFLVPLELEPRTYAGTQAVLASVVDVFRLGAYAVALAGGSLSGLGGRQQQQVLVVAVVCALSGSLLGKRMLGKATVRGIRRLTTALLVLVGLGLLSGAL
ncbi:MAG: sulfite exporter TauE/SafE family protein [Acidobacteria bacterium]|nr:MAG: sulfite exporter TauE/SafE family protein [Acidobacteriota bacterium]REK04612.1 MAG: sulfite exporter TauE/SafE family protein [Acidobacteriota bacterium]